MVYSDIVSKKNIINLKKIVFSSIIEGYKNHLVFNYVNNKIESTNHENSLDSFIETLKDIRSNFIYIKEKRKFILQIINSNKDGMSLQKYNNLNDIIFFCSNIENYTMVKLCKLSSKYANFCNGIYCQLIDNSDEEIISLKKLVEDGCAKLSFK